MGVFLIHSERVTFAFSNSVFIAISREILERKASIFSTFMAKGPLLYSIILFLFSQGKVLVPGVLVVI